MAIPRLAHGMSMACPQHAHGVSTACPRRVHGGKRQKLLVSHLQELGDELLFAKPNIFSHFALGIGDPKYFPVTDMAHLNKLLVEVLDTYNEVNAVMNLVSRASRGRTPCRRPRAVPFLAPCGGGGAGGGGVTDEVL